MGIETIKSGKSAQFLFAFAILATVLFCFQYAGNVFNHYFQVCQSNEIDWLKVDLGKLTSEQVMSYFQWTNSKTCLLSHDFGGKMNKNPAGFDGQKAVCLIPEKLAPPAGSCLVYSFGINNEWSFDDAMAQYGCQVYSFDPSMNAEDHDRTPAIHFFKLGLSSHNLTNEKGWQLRSLSSIFDMLTPRHGDRIIDYLKIDIEFDEWAAIPQIIQSGMMDKIRQLAIEIHLPTEFSVSQIQDRVRILRSIEESGMVRFDSKLNPWSRRDFTQMGLSSWFAHEIAWYNNECMVRFDSNINLWSQRKFIWMNLSSWLAYEIAWYTTANSCSVPRFSE